MKLNERQEELASHRQGRAIGLACPGSGKTKTVTERTGRLIQEGIPANNILSVTFTNKAAQEMRERLTKTIGPAGAKVYISTFHSLCASVLRRMGSALGYTNAMTIADTDDQIELISQLCRKREMEVTKPKVRALATVVNNWRENLETEDELRAKVEQRVVLCSEDELGVLFEYVKVLRQRNQTDFSGLLSETVRLLREHEAAKQWLQNRFKWLQVDEYQDTNGAQNEIVELLAGPEDNVLAIGDQDQSIYEWRGASPEAIQNFIAKGRAKGGCAIYKLGTNYRSTPEIINVAARLIKFCSKRHEIEFRASKPNGDPTKCVFYPNPEEEAQRVAENIQSRIERGTPPKEIAVFYRTNDMSRAVEQALARRRIAYVVRGGGTFYDRMEVKDVLAMLRFLCNPKDGISFSRIANKPTRGMGDAVVGRVEEFAETNQIDVITALQRADQITDVKGKPLGNAARSACAEALGVFGFDMTGKSVADIANDILSRSGYDTWLKAKYEPLDEYEERRRNVNELVNSIALFCQDNANATIADYLQSISLYTDGDEDAEENGVRLMTMHASKGLEFDVVYVIGAEQGITPHRRAMQERPDGSGLDEERRLFYVAITRPRDVLRVTFCLRRQSSYSRSRTAKFDKCEPSQFLVEAGLLAGQQFEQIVGGAYNYTGY